MKRKKSCKENGEIFNISEKKFRVQKKLEGIDRRDCMGARVRKKEEKCFGGRVALTATINRNGVKKMKRNVHYV